MRSYITTPSTQRTWSRETRTESLFDEEISDYDHQYFQEFLYDLDEEFELNFPEYENIEEVEIKLRTEVSGIHWHEELVVEVESKDRYPGLRNMLPKTVKEWSPVEDYFTEEETFTYKLPEGETRRGIEQTIEEILGEDDPDETYQADVPLDSSSSQVEAEV